MLQTEVLGTAEYGVVLLEDIITGSFVDFDVAGIGRRYIHPRRSLRNMREHAADMVIAQRGSWTKTTPTPLDRIGPGPCSAG